MSIGKLCEIVGMDDPCGEYWYMETRGSTTGAVFPDVPHLLTICWFEVRTVPPVVLPFPLRCGVYDVAWRVSRDPTPDEYAVGGRQRFARLFGEGGGEREEEEEEEGGGDGEVELGGTGGVNDGEQPADLRGTPEARNGAVRDSSGVGGGAGNPFHRMAGMMRRLIGRERGVQARRPEGENPGQHSRVQQQDIWERRRAAWRRVDRHCAFKWVRNPTLSSVREEGSAGEGEGEQKRFQISAATIAMMPDWTTLPAGRLTIRGATAGETAVAPALKFRLWETESGWWKDGLYVDALQLTEQQRPRYNRVQYVGSPMERRLRRAATRVSDLPEDCLACVLSFLPPADIARSASVCSAWRAAAASPDAWQRVLPDLCRHACFTALPLVSRDPHPRAWCRALCRGVLLDGGVFHARMDPRTAKFTVSVSIAKVCGVTWMGDPRYWHMETRGNTTGAVFPDVPHLLTVCWFDVNGHVAMPFPLRCGVYDVTWRVSRDAEYAWAASGQWRRSFMWNGRPLWSKVREEGSAGGGGGEQRQLEISTTTIAVLPDWTNLPAGSVTIRGPTPGETTVAPTLNMRLWETESGLWKDGLYLDALQLTEQ
ncbi:unnamed protein product [Closterium sp. Yama58-4]|nr:unnamed protein product [Closterium sp. Yama58-4]